MKILDGQKGKRCSEAEYLEYTHKRCPSCKRTKSVTLFYKKNTSTARGWAWDSKCIECRRGYCRSYGSTNKQRRNVRLREWRRKNPGAARSKDRKARLKAKYGITPEQVQALKEKQNGCCEICRKATTRLFVDHCHVTGRRRSLLCQTCNTFLGWYEKKADTIIRFQKYIESHTH